MSKTVHVFAHAPKTVSTSIRIALEQQFGTEDMAYYCGTQPPVTSDVLREHVYRLPEWDRFRAAIVDSSVKVACGRIPADKPCRRFASEYTTIFLHDPVQRLVSEYQHFVCFRGAYHEFMRHVGVTT